MTYLQLERFLVQNLYLKLKFKICCCNSVAPNINTQSKWVFWNTKIYRKCKFQGVWVELEMKICFYRQSCTKYCKQSTKLSKTGFSMEYFLAEFSQFFAHLSKLAYCLPGRVLPNNSKYFNDFYVFSLLPKISSLKLFGNSWGNSHTHFLVTII